MTGIVRFSGSTNDQDQPDRFLSCHITASSQNNNSGSVVGTLATFSEDNPPDFEKISFVSAEIEGSAAQIVIDELTGRSAHKRLVHEIV